MVVLVVRWFYTQKPIGSFLWKFSGPNTILFTLFCLAAVALNPRSWPVLALGDVSDSNIIHVTVVGVCDCNLVGPGFKIRLGWHQTFTAFLCDRVCLVLQTGP